MEESNLVLVLVSFFKNGGEKIPILQTNNEIGNQIFVTHTFTDLNVAPGSLISWFFGSHHHHLDLSLTLSLSLDIYIFISAFACRFGDPVSKLTWKVSERSSLPICSPRSWVNGPVIFKGQANVWEDNTIYKGKIQFIY